MRKDKLFYSRHINLCTTISICLIALSLTSCAPKASTRRSAPTAFTQSAEKIAHDNGFEKNLIKTKNFSLTTFEKRNLSPKKTRNLSIYIEGDGRTWITRSRLSPNPTPKNPLALKLAVLDKRSHVAYLARPCQYTDLALNPACTPAIWSALRFSKTVIDAMNEAVEILKHKTEATKIHLIGFSGGAAIAVLIAAQRQDIASLRTIAGDLDPTALSRYHHTTPLEGSLDPMDAAVRISKIPQQHFSGAKDTIVPVFIAQNFQQKIQENRGVRAEHIIVETAGHHEGWVEAWPGILKSPCISPGRSLRYMSKIAVGVQLFPP